MKRNLFRILFLVLTIAIYSCSAEDGINGMDGTNGIDGTDGQNGADGADGSDGQDGTNGTDGQNGTDGVDAGGVTYLVLTGDITDAQAATKITERVGPNTQFVVIQNTTDLTTVDLSGISEAVEIEIRDNQVLSSVSFPDLTTVITSMKVNTNPALMTVDIPSLLSADYMNFDFNQALTEINAPLLKELTSAYIYSNEKLTTITFPELQSVINLDNSLLGISDNANLETINISQLVDFGSLQIDGNKSLTSINNASLTNLSNLSIIGNDVLTTFDFSKLTSTSGSINIRDNNLLTAIDFSVLRQSGGISITNNDVLESFAFPVLEKVVQTGITTPDDFIGYANVDVSENEALLNFDMPLLNTIEGRLDVAGNPKLTALDFNLNLAFADLIRISENPEMITIGFASVKELKSLEIVNNVKVQTLDLSDLEALYNNGNTSFFASYISNNNALTEINLPKLNVSTGSLFLTENVLVNTINLPLLTEFVSLSFSNNQNLITVDLSSVTTFNSIYNTGSDSLSSTSVNNILAQLVSISPMITGKDITLSGTATSQGITDRQTLIDNGNNVSVSI